MQTWKCMVRMPSNFIQNIEVEAYNYSDAVSYAESSTGGKCINATPQWKSSVDDDNDSSSEGSSIDGAGILVLAVIAFIVYFWKYILIIGGIALLLWVLYHFMSE